MELSWTEKTEQGPQRRSSFVGWAGGSSSSAANAAGSNNRNTFPGAATNSTSNTDAIELETVFGQGLGLIAGQRVNVEFVKNVETGKSVDVEPLTEDDWEILVRFCRQTIVCCYFWMGEYFTSPQP